MKLIVLVNGEVRGVFNPEQRQDAQDLAKTIGGILQESEDYEESVTTERFTQ